MTKKKAGGLYVPANHELHSSAHLMAQASACVHLLLCILRI